MTERIRHIVDSRELERSFLWDICLEAQKLRESPPLGPSSESKDVYLSFHLPSRITKPSFLRAIKRLGWQSNPESIPSQTMWTIDPENEIKQEVETANLLGYDIIILRSPRRGGAEQAAQVSQVPVINAGEGFEGVKLLYFPQHTSQGITDVATIYHRLGDLDGLTVTVTGDTRENPVTNSLLCTLGHFKAELILAASPGLNGLHREVEEFLSARGVRLRRIGSIKEVLPSTDVLYLAHSQNTERAKLSGYIDQVTPADLELLPHHAIVMHDLIKGTWPEVALEVQAHPKLIYGLQINHGVYGNMALLRAVTSA